MVDQYKIVRLGPVPEKEILDNLGSRGSGFAKGGRASSKSLVHQYPHGGMDFFELKGVGHIKALSDLSHHGVHVIMRTSANLFTYISCNNEHAYTQHKDDDSRCGDGELPDYLVLYAVRCMKSRVLHFVWYARR